MLNEEESITSRPFYSNMSVKFVEGYENYIFQITAPLVSLTHVSLQFCAITATEIAHLKSATDIHKGIHCDISLI